MSNVMMADVQIPESQLREFCQKYRVSRLALFGSRLGSDYRPDSDVDVLVRFQPDAQIGFITFSRMQRELSTMFGRQVDLVTENGLKSLIRDEIISDSRELYAS